MSDHDELEALFEHAADIFAQALAPRLAAKLAAHQPMRSETPVTARRLLSLDQLVERLPGAKTPTTWKRWLYQRTRHGGIPGCHKIGGRLFFDAETTLAWLEKGCTHRELAEPAEQSLHVPTDA